MEVAAVEGDVDGLRRTLSKRHKMSTMRKSRAKQVEPGHVHPKCPSCHALVGRDGQTLNQPKVTVTCAALRRVQVNKAYNPADFEILLLPPTDAHPFYLLPEEYMHIGESSELAAQRTLNDTASLVGMRAQCVAFNGQVARRPHHTVTTLVVLSCAAHERPSAGKFHNLFHVVSNKGAFPLGHGHRELVYEAAGYVRLRCKLETIDALCSASSRTLVSGVKNALFGQHFASHATEAPLITFHNPHFQAEPLRALARARRSSSALLARPLDKSLPTTPGPGASETETPFSRASTAAAAASDIEGKANSPSASPSAALSAIAPAAAAAAADSASVAGPDATAEAVVGRQKSFLRTPSTRQQHLSALRDDDEQDDEDDVVLALRGLNSKSSPRRASQQSSSAQSEESFPERNDEDDEDGPLASHHRIPDGAFNPLADDLDADFSNPLAEEV